MSIKRKMAFLLVFVLVISAIAATYAEVAKSEWDPLKSDWKAFPVCKKDRRRSANYAVQRCLRAQNTTYCQRIDEHGGCDGAIGATTDEIIKLFQQSKGRTADGIVGSNTWGDLFDTMDRKQSVKEGGYIWVKKDVAGASGATVDTVRMKVSNGNWSAEKNNGSYVVYYE